MKLKDALVCENCKEVLSKVILEIIIENDCPKCGCKDLTPIEDFILKDFILEKDVKHESNIIHSR